jgi:hypothetical protein
LSTSLIWHQNNALRTLTTLSTRCNAKKKKPFKPSKAINSALQIPGRAWNAKTNAD